MLKAVIGDIEKAKARARRPQLGYVEAQSSGRLITDTEEVRILPARYGSLRAQALTMRESCALIETLLWER